MTRPRLLDLFCGAGGSAMGYHRAGFDVTGVDIKFQDRYPFEFVQGDALDYLREHWREYDVIHASPPCQAYSPLRALHKHNDYPDLINATRTALIETGSPWVIENVDGAPLNTAIKLCGSSFGLDVRRHRFFESNVLLLGIPCNHSWQKPRFRSLNKLKPAPAHVVGVHGNINYSGEQEIRARAMGIDWMTPRELTQAIPPAYTSFIGDQLIRYIKGSRET